MDGEIPVEELGIPFEAIPEQMSATVGTEYGEFVGAMHLVSNAGESPEVYYYHGDHLGSASWITDASGTAVQHLQYLPYGERFVDQRTSGYCERFTFTGKERDEETGYGYFGARYMDHELMTMWLSVDPMADKYPGISPYAYCAWNPVKLVDPDGRDIWMIDNLGNVVDYIECDDYDCIHIVDGEGNILSSSNYYEPGTISELCLDGQSNTSFSVCGFDNAKEIFEFLAGQYTNSNGMPLEWAHGTIVEKSLLTLSSDNNTNIITTTHEKASVNLDVWLDNDFVISRQAHNHPSGRKYPSNITASNGIRHGDVPTALIFEKIYPDIKNYFYIPSWGYSRYDSLGTLDTRILNQNLLSLPNN